MASIFNSIKNVASMAMTEVVRQSAQDLVDKLTLEFENKLNEFNETSINFNENEIFQKFVDETYREYDENAGDSSKSDQWAIRRRMLGRNMTAKEELFINKCKALRESNLKRYDSLYNSAIQSFDDRSNSMILQNLPIPKNEFISTADSVIDKTKNKFKSDFNVNDQNFIALAEKLDIYMNDKMRTYQKMNVDAIYQLLLKTSLQYGYQVNLKLIE